MPGVTSVGSTGNQDVDGLLSGVKWTPLSLTFSFPASGSYYEPGYGYSEPLTGFAQLNATQQTVVRTIFQNYSAVTNLSFTEITETATTHGDLRFALSTAPSTAWGYYPTTWPEGGDSWYRNSATYSNPAKGNYANLTFVHEIGHALGLKHGHETDAYGAMTLAHDSMEYSVMSYRSYVGASTTGGYVNENWGYAQSLMMYDIAALQTMYGANYNTNSGNTTYSWSPTTGQLSINGVGQGAPGGNRIFMTIWDGNGVDVYDFSNYTTNVTVNLAPGSWTTTSTTQLARLDYWETNTRLAAGNIANALLFNNDTRSLIENAYGGSGNDTIVGNQANNTLRGNAGNDTLNGGDGADSMNGGPGNDTVSYAFSNENWTIDLINDVARASVDELIAEFENIIGGAGNDTLVGNAVANIMTGGAGNDTFVYRPLGNADRITDFVAGLGGIDKIDISMIPSMTSLAAVMAVTTQVGSDTILNFGGGNTLTLSNVTRTNLVDSDFLFNPGNVVSSNASPNDVNGNGVSDILWYRTDGQSLTWLMNGMSVQSTTNLPTTATAWKISGLGDFNGDNTSDVLWYSGGSSFIWQMSGGQVQSTHTLPTIDSGWSVQGIGNFNGDSTGDILWRHKEGHVFTWLMNNDQIVAGLLLGTALPSWHVQSTGDFNGDGSGDILWRDDSGATFMWLMNGGQIGSTVSLGNVARTSHIMNTGDFNGDGTTDIIWHTDAGANFLWLMNGGQVQSSIDFPAINGDWRAVAIGNFNNDGRDDIVWHHSTGTSFIWEMNGGQILAGSSPGAMDTSWRIVGPQFDLI